MIGELQVRPIWPRIDANGRESEEKQERAKKIVRKRGKIQKQLWSCVFLSLIALAGCSLQSRMIQVTVTNTSTEKVSTIVIDYPEATFGINLLEPGKSFQYKIKPTGTGALKIEFLNAHGVGHVSSGPVLHKNDEGSIEIKLTQDEVQSLLKMK